MNQSHESIKNGEIRMTNAIENKKKKRSGKEIDKRRSQTKKKQNGTK